MVEAINAMPTQRSKARVWNIHVVFEPPTPPTSRPAQRPHGRCFTRGRPRWPGTIFLSQQAVERRCEVTMTVMVSGDGDDAGGDDDDDDDADDGDDDDCDDDGDGGDDCGDDGDACFVICLRALLGAVAFS